MYSCITYAVEGGGGAVGSKGLGGVERAGEMWGEGWGE